MSRVASELRRMSLGPSDVARNARLGLWLLVVGIVPFAAAYSSLRLGGVEGGYPAAPMFWPLLALCVLALPVFVLGLVALALALATTLFWRRQAPKT
jgi:hypothetical protein